MPLWSSLLQYPRHLLPPRALFDADVLTRGHDRQEMMRPLERPNQASTARVQTRPRGTLTPGEGGVKRELPWLSWFLAEGSGWKGGAHQPLPTTITGQRPGCFMAFPRSAIPARPDSSLSRKPTVARPPLFDEMARHRGAGGLGREHRHLASADIDSDWAACVKRAARRRTRRARCLALEDDPAAAALRWWIGEWDRADQRLGIGVERPAEQRVARCDLHDSAEIHHRDAVAEVAHHRQIVADEQIGGAERALQLEQQIQDLAAHRDVEGGDRLVTDDEVWRERQRAGNHQSLTLAAGELVRIRVPRQTPVTIPTVMPMPAAIASDTEASHSVKGVPSATICQTAMRWMTESTYLSSLDNAAQPRCQEFRASCRNQQYVAV